MKRRIFLALALVIAAVSMFSLNGCMDMTNGTGVLNVHVYDARYDTEIKVFPCILIVHTKVLPYNNIHINNITKTGNHFKYLCL
jgi:hypothetical protein